MICPSSRAHANAKRIVEKLKEEIPRQQYEVNISASLGHSKKAIARTLVKPVKKDFAGVMKGGNGNGFMTSKVNSFSGNFVADRLGKKMRHQQEGKERMKMLGNIQVPREVFLNVVRK